MVYDFDGNLISKHSSFVGIFSFIPFENSIYAHHTTSSDDRKATVNIFSRFDPRNMTEQKIHQFSDNDGIMAIWGERAMYRTTPVKYSTFQNSLYISFGIDNLIHQLQGNRLVSAYRINITPNTTNVDDRYFSGFRGFVGHYLFVNYRINGKNGLYIYNTRTRQGHNIANDNSLTNQGIRDNIYATGFITDIKRLNRDGYFYYIKNAGEMREMPRTASGASHPVVFIAKIKE
jgi:hypothetical protein